MQIIHATAFIDQQHTSEAYIFSSNPIDRGTAENLLFAQAVVEARWSPVPPVFAIEAPDLSEHDSSHIYEDIHLILPTGWGLVDDAEAFLINAEMYKLCKTDDAALCHLNNTTSQELVNLFETTNFILACSAYPDRRE